MSINWTIADLKSHILMLAMQYNGRISRKEIFSSIRTNFIGVTDADICKAIDED